LSVGPVPKRNRCASQFAALAEMAAGQRLLSCIASRNGLLASKTWTPALNHSAIRNYAASISEDITIEVCTMST